MSLGVSLEIGLGMISSRYDIGRIILFLLFIFLVYAEDQHRYLCM